MNLAIRKQYSKWLICFLVFMLTLTPLLNTPSAYAETDSSQAITSEDTSTNTPDTSAPQPENPPVEVPETTTPEQGTPPVDGPDTTQPETPSIDTPDSENPPVDTPDSTTPQPEEPPVKKPELPIIENQDPLAPQNLRVEEMFHNRALLEWDFVSGENDIQIWDADTNGWNNWGNKKTRYAINLKPETTYRVYITWNDDSAKAHKSNIVEFTTIKDESEYKAALLTPPSNFKITSVTEDSVILNWGVSPGAKAYDLYVNKDYGGNIPGNTVTTTTYSPPSPAFFEVGKEYTFKIAAQNLPDVSANSNAVTITWGELAAPKALQVITATRTTAALGWAAVPGATSYDIYNDGVMIGSSDDNRYVAEGLEEGNSYKYSIVAKNNLWTSSESEFISVVPGSEYTNVAYYTSWSNTSNRFDFKPTDVDASQITHINYAFADICWKKYGTTGARACENSDISLQNRYVYDGEIVIGDPGLDLINMDSWVSIREQNPHLKLMVSVGGWTWSKNFSNMARDEITRRTFANSAVKFLREYKLDGLDVDWEYPVEGGEETNSRGPEDRENFSLLMNTVREALDTAGSEDGKYYLLTIASKESDSFVSNADLMNSVQYLDFINIMTYDYSGTWENNAFHNSPIYYDTKHPRSSAARNNVLGGLNGHLKGGVPTYKLVAGIPYYGKGWTGCKAPGEYQNCTGFLPGTFASNDNLFDFFDIENKYLNKNGYVRYWNDAAKVAYVYNEENGNFITYNDKTTMMYTSSLVKTLDIAGVMSWDISGDRNKTLTTQLVHDLPIHGEVNTSALPAPQNLVLSSKSANALTLKWDAVSGATGYEIYVDKAMVGTTTDTSYTVNSLTPEKTYSLHLLAITKSGDEVQAVSIASDEISATTTSTSVTPSEPGGNTGGESGGSGSSGGSGGGSTTPAPAPTPSPAPGKDQVAVKINKQADKSVVSIPESDALKAINASDSKNFQIQLGDIENQAEIEVPQGLIAAIAKKGEQGSLSMMMNGIEHWIPVSLLSTKGNVKVTIGVPTGKDADSVNTLLKGVKSLSKPTLFKIDQINADKSITDLNFGKSYVSEFITLDPKQVQQKRAVGMVYIPGTNELRSVPTLFTVLPDGKIKVELKKSVNGIYTLVENELSFNDVSPAWAKEDVAQAVAKLIASGERANWFGGKQDITRAEMVSMIVKGLGIMPDSDHGNFKDVDAQTKYAQEIAAAKAAGLVQGKTGDRFDPNGLLTREELAVILANAMEYTGMKHDTDSALLAKFKDHAEISSYAKIPLAMLVEHKIIQGVTTSKVAPKMNVTKDQTVVIVMRMLRSLGLAN